MLEVFIVTFVALLGVCLILYILVRMPEWVQMLFCIMLISFAVSVIWRLGN
jgi:hypothetical protein